MLIPSNNKNSLINFERNHWKHQKPQISISLKFSLKCMKKKNLKKEGKNSLTGARRQKPLRKIEGKQQKKLLWIWIGWRERERERAFWKILNSEEHMKISCFKKLSKRFSIDRKLHSIDPTSIEHRSNQTYSNQNFNHNFD